MTENTKLKRGRGAKVKADAASRERAMPVLHSLSRYNGVSYSGTLKHCSLICARLDEGLSALELRKVAWYCAVVLGWKSDAKMFPYLRPETLYGPETISRYLDAARTEYRKRFGTDEDVSK